MNILSIQSSVAFGHVGNSAAVFPLQRLGHEVWPINTVQFSNHTGYGKWRGEVFPASHLADVLQGMDDRGALADCQAVLSGYLGDAAIGNVVLDAVERLRADNSRALYCCDPVMGDEGRGIFVRPDIPGFFTEKALPAADIATPNQFELELLTGIPIHSLADAVRAAQALRERGPSVVAITSLRAPAVPEGHLGSMVVSGQGAWLVDTPLLDFPILPNGAGDVFAALLLGRLMTGEAPAAALEKTVSGLYGLLTYTLSIGMRELALVAAQNELVHPSQLYQARQVAS
ncbi:pyridoxal kinase PdxY [Telmatospirillum siberiense]|uniref:pyridoxal kinase n=1 Tax=Telmatospirillum siberiense TaxID=382514 RepID=A0A2N3PY47_9PROT|nr:pyridoxal kinase PdxY [Telmatospirillum siberiense]PKU25334.1 pyridoxal kinase [Telmatospirillum siberiense]